MDDLSCGNSLSFQPSGMLGLILNVLPMVFGTLQSLQTTREAKAAESKSNCDPWGVGKPLAATTVPIEQIWTGCTMVTAHPRIFRKWKFRFQCTVSFTFPCLLSSNSDPLRAANPYFIRMWRRRLCLPGTPSVSTATTSILPPLVSSIQTANWGEGTSVILQGFVSEEGKSKSPSFWHKVTRHHIEDPAHVTLIGHERWVRSVVLHKPSENAKEMADRTRIWVNICALQRTNKLWHIYSFFAVHVVTKYIPCKSMQREANHAAGPTCFLLSNGSWTMSHTGERGFEFMLELPIYPTQVFNFSTSSLSLEKDW